MVKGDFFTAKERGWEKVYFLYSGGRPDFKNQDNYNWSDSALKFMLELIEEKEDWFSYQEPKLLIPQVFL